jgi:hypothetical protein
LRAFPSILTFEEISKFVSTPQNALINGHTNQTVQVTSKRSPFFNGPVIATAKPGVQLIIPG